MNRQFLIMLLIVFSINHVTGQKQANNWYFGENAGLSFGSGSPIAQTDGWLSTMEGTATISTEDGELLFYTDGVQVLDSSHTQMQNGFGLLGNNSSTQPAIIIPKPNSENLFYIFTTDDVAHGNGGDYGLNYTLVDMDLEDGLGDVVDSVKNITLTTPMCEKITAVVHANNIDVWLIAQKWETNHIYSYLITEEGVNHTPIISELGEIISGSIHNAKGYMKVSANGTRLAKANAGLHSVEVFDFDDETGLVSNPMLITEFPGEPYGIEFSQNNNILYVNTWKTNYIKEFSQFDLEAGTIDEIIASKFIVANGTEGALQLAPDDRIYVAMNGNGSLSIINFPNYIGEDCGFEYGTISLGGRYGRWGLPNFMQSFFRTLTDIDEIEVVKQDFEIYPNPSNGKFAISFNETVTKPELIILNLNGQQIHSQKFAHNYSKGEKMELSIDFPKKGIYFIKIKTEERDYFCKLLIQ